MASNIQDSPNKQAGTPVSGFRDPLLQANYDSAADKKDKEYGRKLLSRIFKEQTNQTNTMVYAGRNIKWLEIWKWAMGRQEMKEFQDFTSINGDKAYVNIDWEQNRTGTQFVETLVNSMCIDEEYPKVSAVDDGSKAEKTKRKNDALFRMHDVHNISDIQQRAGMHMEPPNAYVPDDEMIADIHFKLDDRLPKEIEYEEKLSKIMVDNEYPTLKRRIKRYGIVLNCMCTKIEKLENGYIGIKNVIPPNLIYNFFMSDSGKMELSYIGELYKLKIKDLRKKYGKAPGRPDGLSELDIFNMGKNANQINTANRFIYNWDTSYVYATDRPYDDYGIDVFDCEIQTFDEDYYVSKVDKFGKENIQPKKTKPAPTSDKATVLSTGKLVWRRGVLAIHANQMIYWGLPDVTIKPYMDIQESLSSYTIQIPNNDGDYVPSLFERALSPLRELQLCELKRKQLISEMRPAGISIEIESIMDLDLGNGNSIPWEETLKMYNQKGIVVWRRRSNNPSEFNERPIEEMANAGSVAQLEELCNIIDRCKMDIRAVLGVPMYRDGSDLKPRMGQAVVENQQANANNVTDFINSSYLALMQETFHKCCILEWDKAVIEGGDSTIINTQFEIKVELKPRAEEKLAIEQMIQTGMQEQLLTFKDAFRIRHIAETNYKLADMYLIAMEEQNKRQAQQDAASQQQALQAQAQQLAQQKAQQDAALQQQMDQNKALLDDAAERRKKEEILLTGILGIFAQSVAHGTQYPAELQPLTQMVIANVMGPLAQENKELGQALMAAAQSPAPQAQGQPPQGQPAPPDPMQQPQQQQAA